MTYKMFDKNFKEISIDGDWCYLYVTNWEDFLEEYGDEWTLDGISEDGIYIFDVFYEYWSELTENSFAYKEILKRVLNDTKNTKEKWNIIVTLDTGEKIQTNTIPVSIEDVQEAIGVLVKPSILGMRIKSIEIVAE